MRAHALPATIRALLLAAALTSLLGGATYAQVGNPASVTAVVPTQVAQGAVATVVQIHGTGFIAGIAIVRVADPTTPVDPIQFGTVQTLTPSLAMTSVSVRRDAAPGIYQYAVTQRGIQGVRVRIGQFGLRVVVSSSVVAPLSVTAMAIVHPQEGTLLGEGEQLFPRALLAVTGTGTVTGRWELDGVPFDRFTVSARVGLPVSVEARQPIPRAAQGDHTLIVRVDSLQQTASAPVTLVVVPPRAALLRLVAPLPGARLGADEAESGPVFRWTPQPGAVAYEVRFSQHAAESPATRAFRVTGEPWEIPLEARRRLGDGRFYWCVRPLYAGGVPGTSTAWRELVLGGDRGAGGAGTGKAEGKTPQLAAAVAPGSVEPPPSAQLSQHTQEPMASQSATPTSDRQLAADLSATWINGHDVGEEDQAHLTGRASLVEERQQWRLDGSADLSLLKELEGEKRFIQEADNFVLNGRLGSPRWGLLGSAGYFGPVSLADTRFLDAGLARAGIELGVQTPVGAIRCYSTDRQTPSGTTSGLVRDDLRVPAASFALPIPASIGSLRLMATNVTEPASVQFGTPELHDRSYGALGTLQLGRNWQAIVEGARSSVTQQAVPSLTGQALSLSFAGQVAGTDLAFGVQHTNDNFANLAAGSFAAGSIPNRTSANVAVARALSTTSVSVQLRWVQSGELAASATPAARQLGLDAAIATALSTAVQFAWNGSYSDARSDSNATNPEVTVRDAVMGAGLTETLGGLVLTQRLAYQSTRNRGPVGVEGSDLDVWNGTLLAAGALGASWSLQGNATWSRNTPAAGTALDAIMVSFQPAWLHAASGVMIGPWLAATWNDLPEVGTARTIQALLTAAWNPPVGRWGGLGASIAVGWVENRTPATLEAPQLTQRDTRVALTLSWRLGEGLAPAPASTMPIPGRATATAIPAWHTAALPTGGAAFGR
jgi:hypothetical protein